MTAHSDEAALCDHMVPGPYPFESILVLDDHLGPTDWLVRCSTCGQPCLLEMLDWSGSRRLYRVRLPEEAAVAGLMRDLTRGSCDLSRAGEEARHVGLMSPRLNDLLLLDLGNRSLVSVLRPSPDCAIPGAGWRELDCDGDWIDRLTGDRTAGVE